jgi:hypothetical protein
MSAKSLLLPIILVVLTISAHAQTFTSNQNGNWTTASTWTRSNPYNCSSLRNPPPATSDYSVNCRVDVVVNHQVLFNSTATFGGGYFRTLTVNGPNGILDFQGNAAFNTSGSSLPTPNNVIFNIQNGARMNVLNGELRVDRDGVINITGNSTVTVRDLVLNANNATINVEAGSKLIVLNNTTLNSSTVLNVQGQFSTNNLIFNSGGTFNANGESIIEVKNNLTLGNGTLNNSGNSEIKVGGSLNMSGGGKYVSSNNAFIEVAGNLNISSTNPILIKDGSGMVIKGTRSGNISGLSVTGNGCYQSANDPNSCARLLPVEYLYFTTIFNGQERSAQLSWATAKEWENSHFIIERSVKGIDAFQAIAEVAGMGWKDNETVYNYTDRTLPYSVATVYYRLKQVDFDGTFSTGKVNAIKTTVEQAATQLVWKAYPNPVSTENLIITLIDAAQFNQESISFRIVHQSFVTELQTVNSEREMNEKLGLMIPKAPKGILVIEVRWGQKVEHLKVIKK